VYIVQKGDDDDDESDSDGGSAADLVMSALVIQSSSGQPGSRLDFLAAAPLMFPLATGFCRRLLSI
jgi:hypothetical protein